MKVIKVPNMIEKIFKTMNKIQHDKSLHALYGLFVYSLVATVSPLIAIVIVILLGVGKEVYDSLNIATHTPDVMDAVYTIVPAGIVYIVTLITG